MKYTSLLVVAALMAFTQVEQTQAIFLEKKKKKEDPPPTAADTPSSEHFGADEDDVYNNIFNHYATTVQNAAGELTGAKVLYKENCQKACAEILLVTKQVSEAKMEQFMAEFYPRTWAKFDVNNQGEIDITESHTFMRSLLGRLNQFVLAPGSLTDIKVE